MNLGDKRQNVLMGWINRDFAADPDTRRLVTGYVVSMNNCPISGSWKAKRQGCMTLSSESAEAEFVAARQCGQEVVYLRNLLAHLGYEQKEVTRVYEDNAACIKMSENAANPCSSRHIDTRVHFILELMPDKVLHLHKVKSSLNLAGALTKCLPAPAFHQHREYLIGCRVPFESFFTSVVVTAGRTAAAA